MPTSARSDPVGEMKGTIAGGARGVGREGGEVEKGGKEDFVGGFRGGEVEQETAGFGRVDCRGDEGAGEGSLLERFVERVFLREKEREGEREEGKEGKREEVDSSFPSPLVGISFGVCRFEAPMSPSSISSFLPWVWGVTPHLPPGSCH